MIGVFGGSFNPIHTGHLLLAEFIRDEFKLERVVFIPAGNPPHKPDEELESEQHRFNMVQMAIAKNQYFEASAMELNREGISYTVDTLTEITNLYPEKKIHFICGADSIINLPTWRNIGRIFELADLVVAGRPNTSEPDFQNMLRWFRDQFSARIFLSNAPHIELSSTMIRKRIRDGQSVRYMVPDEVDKYIQLQRLY